MTLRLVTANIASGRDVDGVTRPDRLTEALATLGADVLALQEVDRMLPRSGSVDQAALVAAALPGDGWTPIFAAALDGAPGPGGGSRPATASRPDVPSYGNALVTRHPVERVDELRLAPARGRRPLPLPPGTRPPVWFIADEQRVALAARLTTDHGPVTIVTTHLSFAPVRAARQLRRVREWVRGLPEPVVLAGDLNLPGRVPARLTGWASLVAAPTFPAARPRLQLDHVLAAPGHGLTAVRSRSATVGGSDHRGLVVDLHLG